MKAYQKGRGTIEKPTGRFESMTTELEEMEDPWQDPREDAEAVNDDYKSPKRPYQSPVKTEYYVDHSRSVIATNNSPDIGFEASLNPYRGCEHGCIYCYARPTHEYLGHSAGIDFETKIFVKQNAPQLLREKLNSKSWQPKTLTMSGVTDLYQPVERKLKLTRQCLQVLAEFRNPVMIITKNYLVTRDIDVLKELARFQAVQVMISLTTLDAQLVTRMEPRTSRPQLRLKAIRQLRDAGIPVGVMMAPVIPGLTDH